LSKLVLNREENGYEGYGEEDNWTHICTLWELPYAHVLILMHNIDVMHQEHNIAESIISTCMDITSKTKDNFKARRDISHVCNRPSLELDERGGKPHAPFCLKVKDKRSDEMDEKIVIPRSLRCRIETMCECEGRKNSWVKEP
jgi:hypothetical protein